MENIIDEVPKHDWLCKEYKFGEVYDSPNDCAIVQMEVDTQKPLKLQIKVQMKKMTIKKKFQNYPYNTKLICLQMINV